MEQDWFVINPESWFLATFKTLEQKLQDVSNKLPIYKIEKQEPSSLSIDTQQRIDIWLLDEAEKIFQSDNCWYFCEEQKEKNAYRGAVDKFINNFDKIDDGWEFVSVNKEDDPESWRKEKDLILSYLKSL